MVRVRVSTPTSEQPTQLSSSEAGRYAASLSEIGSDCGVDLSMICFAFPPMCVAVCTWWPRMKYAARSRWTWWMARTASRSSTPTCVVDEGAFE